MMYWGYTHIQNVLILTPTVFNSAPLSTNSSLESIIEVSAFGMLSPVSWYSLGKSKLNLAAARKTELIKYLV